MLVIVQHFSLESPMSDMPPLKPSNASAACEAEILAYGGAWEAALSLRLGLRQGRCVVLNQDHRGPLRLQKLFWPEGPNPAHGIVLHPPGGLASGDELALSLELEPGAALVMTTPGAGKWYRAKTPVRQAFAFELGAGASLEWLPQETLIFEGAALRSRTDWHLDEDAFAASMEILVFGRKESGESHIALDLHQCTSVYVNRQLLYRDPMHYVGRNALNGAAVMAGKHVSGLLWLYSPRLRGRLSTSQAEMLDQSLAAIESTASFAGVFAGASSLGNGMLIIRSVGDDPEALRTHLQQAWSLLRPWLDRPLAHPPRIWAT
ncbi:MAG: urease accessory protein UreD [Betaproteobacteria bacterium]